MTCWIIPIGRYYVTDRHHTGYPKKYLSPLSYSHCTISFAGLSLDLMATLLDGELINSRRLIGFTGT